MRLFQRAFKRAGLPLKHTQGFNPRPSVSIALPLSVGVSSHCELLDFDLEGEGVPGEIITEKLNSALVEGVRVLKTYEDGRKLKELAYLSATLTLEYDNGLPPQVLDRLTELFQRPSLTVEKKGKNGVTQQDIIPMLRHVQIHEISEREVEICCCVCCQNPSLNPTQLVNAIALYLPELSPDHAVCCRQELYDIQMNIFR
jgi:radical SAM-linked protein